MDISLGPERAKSLQDILKDFSHSIVIKTFFSNSI